MDVNEPTRPAQRQLQLLLDALEVNPPDCWSWFGVRWRTPDGRPGAALSESERRARLRDALGSHLYANFYCVGHPRRIDVAVISPLAGAPAPAFVQALVAANPGRGPWHPGWSIEGEVDGQLIVSRDHLSLVVPRQRIRDSHGPERRVVDVRMPSELLGMSPGYYMAVGDRDLLDDPAGAVSRFYWNSTASTAPELLRRLTRALNRLGIPFRLKALKSPGLYDRCDAIVLYVRKADLDRVAPAIEQTYEAVREGLSPSVPALTKVLAPGLAAADDPQDGESFGTHRCNLIAAALVGAGVSRADPQAAVHALSAAFRSAGLDVERPYLGPSQDDCYPEVRTVGASVRAPRRARRDAPPPLVVAESIGDWLQENAVWHGDLCNWIGGPPVEASAEAEASSLQSGALDGTIFSGTSGIAMFFAELSTLADGPAFRVTALGAARHALDVVDRRGEASWGLFDGLAGVGVATCYVGRLLGDDDVTQRGAQLVQRLSAATEVPSDTDLISGLAGAVLALLVVDRLVPNSAHLAAAVRLGDALVEAGHPGRAGLCWQSLTVGGRRVGLTGISHGAAGIGMALAELGTVTGTERFRRAARQAFDYERAYFNPTLSNWADLRGYGGGRANARWMSYAPFWCHGAAGITLSRLHGAAAGLPGCIEEARHGLRATQDWLASATAREDEAVVLCHGVAGNAEVLRLAAQSQASVPRVAHTVRAAERHVRRRFASNPSTWPCQSTGGLMVPGLMCGLAGVGHFLLRSIASEVPSMLFPLPGPFARRLGQV